MGMFHSTSGKRGYNYHVKPSSYEITKDVAILLLREEQRLRREEATQEAYTKADADFQQLEQITLNLQQQALKNVLGMGDRNPMLLEALNAFRNLRAIYKDDPDVNRLTDYFKYDMSRDCNVEHVDLETIKIVDLLDYYDFDKEVNNVTQMPSSEELITTQTKTLGQFLKERNTKNLPVAIIAFKEKVFLVTVYIKEAHACDQWKLGNKINIEQHKSTADRIDATKMMIMEMNYRIPTVVDTIENGFEENFTVWPEKFVLMNNEGKVFSQSKPESYGHSPATFCQKIEQYLSSIEPNSQ